MIDPEVVRRFRERVESAYVAKRPKSRTLRDQARRFLPGGDTRTITFFRPFPAFIEAASGCRLTEADGHVLIDFLNNYTSMVVGHAHPRVVAAVAEQVRRGTAYAAPTEGQIRLAEALCGRVPSLEKVRFCNSGTEAVMNALRLARAHTGRPLVAKMEGGYHGTADPVEVSVHPSISMAGPPDRPRAIAETPGLAGSTLEETLILQFNDAAATETLLMEHRARVAAVIVEPVMGVAGCLPARREYLERLRKITAELGMVLIFDEVMTFRLARAGAQEMYGIRPDLTVFGKLIGGGLPVGAFGGRDDLMVRYAPDGPAPMSQSGTFNGNPLTMVAGLATLEVLTEGEIGRINELGSQLRRDLQATFDRAGVPARVTGSGSLLNIHFTGAEVTDYRGAATGDRELAAAFHLALMNQGIFTAGRGLMCLSTPMGREEIRAAVRAVEACLAELQGTPSPSGA